MYDVPIPGESHYLAISEDEALEMLKSEKDERLRRVLVNLVMARRNTQMMTKACIELRNQLEVICQKNLNH